MRHPPGGKGTIMVEATFTKSMHALLSRTKGSTLLSYECAKDERFSRIYGNCRIHLNDGIIEVANEPKQLPFFGAMESMTCFTCHPFRNEGQLKRDEFYLPYSTFPVGGKINSVEIVTDYVNVNHGAYQVSFDMALLFHMDKKTLMLARDTWFSQLLTVTDERSINTIFPIEEVINSWSNYGEYAVDVKRMTTKL